MLEVLIFSYNRGSYLKNCIDSLSRNAPNLKFTVFDDASDDAATLSYLDEIRDNVVVCSPEANDRHGGLYNNMNKALSLVTEPYFLVLQDDMQVIRKIDAADLATIYGIFSAYPQAAFLGPLFLKQRKMRRYRRQLRPGDGVRAYTSSPDERANLKMSLAYFDCHIGSTARLTAADWKYSAISEDANARNALATFGPMPTMADPVAFFCPDVPFFRNRKDPPLSSRMAAWHLGAEVKVLHDMSAEDVSALRDRDMGIWPVAEHFLSAQHSSVRKPFTYQDVKARWWLYALHKMERWLKL